MDGEAVSKKIEQQGHHGKDRKESRQSFHDEDWQENVSRLKIFARLENVAPQFVPGNNCEQR